MHSHQSEGRSRLNPLGRAVSPLQGVNSTPIRMFSRRICESSRERVLTIRHVEPKEQLSKRVSRVLSQRCVSLYYKGRSCFKISLSNVNENKEQISHHDVWFS